MIFEIVTIFRYSIVRWLYMCQLKLLRKFTIAALCGIHTWPKYWARVVPPNCNGTVLGLLHPQIRQTYVF